MLDNHVRMSPVKSFDLHGMRVAEAEALFYKLLNEIRLKGDSEEVTFITGVGVIQDRLKVLAKENDLSHYIQMANRGVIVIEFE